MKQVVVVREGEWGFMSQSKGDYNHWFGRLSSWTKGVADLTFVETVRDFDMYRAKTDVVVFVSRGMREQARVLKSSYPDLTVILLTGLPDWKERTGVVVLDKAVITKEEWLKTIE